MIYCIYCLDRMVGRCQYCGLQGAEAVAHDWDQLQQHLADFRAENERLRLELCAAHEDSAMSAHSMANTTVDATARAEAAEKEADRLRAEVAAICRITKGNAADLTKPVDTVAEYVTEMRGRVNDLTSRAEAAERERDEAQAHAEDLRGALEEAVTMLDGWKVREWYGDRQVAHHELMKFRTILNRTPAQSLARLKAEVLRELAEKMRGMDMDIGAEIADSEADQLEKEAADGTN